MGNKGTKRTSGNNDILRIMCQRTIEQKYILKWTAEILGHCSEGQITALWIGSEGPRSLEESRCNVSLHHRTIKDNKRQGMTGKRGQKYGM